MIGRWLFKRKVRKALVASLLEENANLRAMLKAEQGPSEDVRALHKAVARWLDVQIALFHVPPPAPIPSAEAHMRATDELERAARRCFLSPGMKGSWGRGVPRTWACEFGGPDTNHLCECAGGGLTDAECRHCFYRPPVGEKGRG